MSKKSIPQTLISFVTQHTNLAKTYLRYNTNPAEAWIKIEARVQHLPILQLGELQKLCQVDAKGNPTPLRLAELQTLNDSDKQADMERKIKLSATRARVSSALTPPQSPPVKNPKYQKPGIPKTKGSKGTHTKDKLHVRYAPMLYSFLHSIQIKDSQTLHTIINLVVDPEHASPHTRLILKALQNGHPAYAEVLAKLPSNLFSQPEKRADNHQTR